MLPALPVRGLELPAQVREAHLGVVEAAVQLRLLLLAVLALLGDAEVVAAVRPDLVAGERAPARREVVLPTARLAGPGARVRVVAPVDGFGVRAHDGWP